VIPARSIALTIALLLGGSAAYAQQKPAMPPTTPPQRPQPAPRAAQAPRIHLEVDGLYHAATQTLSDSASPVVYAETGSLGAAYDVPAGPGFSGGAGFRLWRNFGVGATVSSFSTTFPATVTGSIPKPFFFNQARPFEGSVSDLARKELAIGVHLRGIFQLTPKFAVSVFAGPSRLSVTQDVVTAIQYTESYPYDTATFSAALVTEDKVNKWGVGAGADVAFYITRNIGVGVGLKYNGGEADLASLSGRTLTSKIGGAEFGGGLRLRF
jgi:opacity protein-like surface antigen